MRNNKIAFYTLVAIVLSTSMVSSCKKEDDVAEKKDKINFNPNIVYGSVTDIDGNKYKTITVVNRVWMAENLRVTHYNDGSSISNTNNNTEWSIARSGAYCWMNYDAAEYKNIYGALYNQYAVADGRNLCPAGWHAATYHEWTELAGFFGGTYVVGDKIKEAGISHWEEPNTADNSSGFTALPGGGRANSGEYYPVGVEGYWWTSTKVSPTEAVACYLGYNSSNLMSGQGDRALGLSVRCIKDEYSVKTLLVSDIKQTTATSGGNILGDNGVKIIERGVCWSTKQNPTVTDSKTSDGKGIGVYTSSLTGLTKDTTYYVRAYANNGVEVQYGNEVSFTTHDLVVPTLTTIETSNISFTSVASGGIVSDDGGLAVTARGVCWGTSPNPTIDNSNLITNGSGLGIYTCNLTGLSENTVYYIRAYATNSKGTAYGNEISFKTHTKTIPTVTTNVINNIESTTATCGGNVIEDGGVVVTARGVCWSTLHNPTIELSTKTNDGEGIGFFNSDISNLTINTTYYVRAYATNAMGTAYGDEFTFITRDVVSDIDGNKYHYVTIGTQVWMVENLKTTKYRDGTTITYVTDNTSWVNQTTGAYCWYNNEIGNKALYGALYNYYTVVDSRNLCPTGWHIPSSDEWYKLNTFLGGSSIAGGKLKKTGFDNWISPNTGATNESGFTGLPGGYRLNSFANIGSYGYHWSNTYDVDGGWFIRLNSSDSNSTLTHVNNKAHGFSVRCLKD